MAILETIADSAKKELDIKMSTVTETAFKSLISLLSLKVTSYHGCINTPTGISFDKFVWNDRREDDISAIIEARNLLETQLSKFGVLFGVESFKLSDIHSKCNILKVNDSRFTLSGSTDFVIIPYHTDVDFSTEMELCVLFELKTDKTISDNKIIQYFPQAMTELVAARYLSRQPGVLVVLTDLCSNAALFELHYSEETSFSVKIYRDMSLEQMAVKVRQFLDENNEPNALFEPSEDIANAPVRDHGVIAFKKRKICHESSLALEQLQDVIMGPNEWTYKEKAQIFANLFDSVEEPMPISVRYAMYS